MATQYWDSAQSARTLAEAIDEFLYVDGKTSPKTRKLRKHTEKEYREFLDGIREGLWEEYTDMMRDMGHIE